MVNPNRITVAQMKYLSWAYGKKAMKPIIAEALEALNREKITRLTKTEAYEIISTLKAGVR